MSDIDRTTAPGGLIGWFIKNHVAANILMMFLVLGGIMSVRAMRTETFPSIDPRMISITVSYPGATPGEIADSVTSRAEEALLGIEGVKRISSTASEGMGAINVELTSFADEDDVYSDVETAIEGINAFPPEDAEKVTIKKVRPTPEVLSVALHGDVSEDVLRYWTDIIEDEIKQIPGASLTSVRGVRSYQISVELSESELRKYNISLAEVSNAIGSYAVDIPAGNIEAEQGDILVRVQDKRYTGKELEKVVIKTLQDGSSLYLRDIAKVIDGFDDDDLISKFNGERSSFIDIKRSESQDTLTVANAVKEYLATVKLPKNLTLSLQKDRTTILKDRISLMVRNGILGFVLVFAILLLFLDLKLAFWISAAIPISFLGGLMIINFFGYSLNMVSLFALIVVLGIVVDDGIVVGESIYESQEKLKGHADAVNRGVHLVLAPVTIGVLTTVAAFAPLAFSTGVMGQIIGIIPVIVIAILFVSLLEAYFILPSHLSEATRWSSGIMADIRNKFSYILRKFIMRYFIKFISFALRWRYAVVAMFIAVAIMTAGMVSSGFIRFVFFPRIEGDSIKITAKTPTGSSFAITKDMMLEIEEEVLKLQKKLEIDNNAIVFESIAMTIGQSVQGARGPVAGGSASNSSNIGEMRIKLVPSDYRQHTSYEIEAMIRKNIEDITSIDDLDMQSSSMGEDADIEIELKHNDGETLNKAAEYLKTRLEAIQGTKEVSDSFEPGKTEYVFKLNQEGLALGLTPSSLGRQLRSSFFGAEAQRFQRGSSEIVVYVRYPKADRNNLAVLNDIRLTLPNGNRVPLNQVTDIVEQQGYSQINTVNGKVVVSVTADVDYAITTPNDVMRVIDGEIFADLEAQFPGINYSYEGETREQKEDLAGIFSNMRLAIILIFVLLGGQLRSYIQPLIIMSAIPFGVVGAVLGHLVLGYDLTFISIFGIVALIGVVVNDSVVLLDFLNHLYQEKGNNLKRSILMAVQRRFRPIMLTTLSTSLGLLPILTETSRQARFLQPMVVSLAMGILFATIVIMLLVPSLVMIMDDVKRATRRLFN